MKKLLTIVALLAVSLAANTNLTVAQENKPTFGISTPKEGQTLYGPKVPILFNVENFTLANQGTSSSTGHILVWLDQEAQTVENATKVVENTFVFSDVLYGQHSLTAELVTSDNKSFTPPLKSTVNFNSEVLPAEEQKTITNGFDKTTAVVILAVVALVILAAWWYTKDEDDDPDSEENLSKPKRKTAKKSKTKAKPKKKKK